MSRLVLSQITIKKERSISSTTWYYLLQPATADAPNPYGNVSPYEPYGNSPPTIAETGYSGWSTTEPTYTVGDSRVLYQMVQTVFSDGNFSYTSPSISSSYEAAKAAYSEALLAEADIEELQDLGLHHGYIWTNQTAKSASGGIPAYPIGSYIASGINNTINQANSNTYGLNTWISTGGINLRYNAIDLAKLTTSTLEFYYPSTSNQGTAAISLGTHSGINSLIFYEFGSTNKKMELTGSNLNFYGSSQSTADASLTSTGLKLVKGGIEAGTPNTNGYIYFSTEDYPLKDSQASPAISGLTINGYTPSKTGIDGRTIDDSAWRQIIGTKFGVTADGTLYASNANIQGTIVAEQGIIKDSVTVGTTSQTPISTVSTAHLYANNYIGISGGGIKVAAANPTSSSTTNYVEINSGAVNIVADTTHKTTINSSGMNIFSGDQINPIAQFGSTVYIGKYNNTQSYLQLDYHSLQMFDKENNPYFHVSDLRGVDGKATINETFSILEDSENPGTVLDTWYVLKNARTVNDVYDVTLNNTATNNYQVQLYPTGVCVKLTSYSGVNIGDKLTVYYYATGSKLKALTFGSRKTVYSSAPGLISIAMGEDVIADGAYSFATGYKTAAYGIYSHAEGEETIAGGAGSHAEGRDTTTSGLYCHAEGSATTASASYSHAEGTETIASGVGSHAEGLQTTASGLQAHAEGTNTTASGHSSHAEGRTTLASGNYSHASGYGTIASTAYQTVIGTFNAEEFAAFVIGYGSSDTNRANIFVVDWDGNVNTSGNVDANGTVLGVVKRVGAITGEAPSTEPTIATGASWKNLRTITLTKGVWMVTIGAEFDGNSTGIRAITLATGSSGATSAGTIIRTVRTAAASTGLTTLQATFPVDVTASSQDFYLNAFQTSGSTLTVKPRHTAVQIGNSTST